MKKDNIGTQSEKPNRYKKSAESRKRKYGEDWFKKIGKKGGHATLGVDWATRGVIKGARNKKKIMPYSESK